ncbi:MAG: metallophosphoesterase [Candidatus Nanohaloarchaea archaeon]
MNKHVVKQLTKEGCIVAKEAAEDLKEDDIEKIRSLDTTPMYISGEMLSKLRDRNQDSDNTVISNGSRQTVQKQKPANGGSESSELELAETSSEESEADKSSTESVEIDESDSSGSSSGNVTIRDTGDRGVMNTKVEILDEKDINREKKDVPEFLQYYNDRYERMKKLLMRRMELKSATTLNRLSSRNEGDDATAVGLVRDKYSTSSGKYIVSLEDKTDSFKVLVDEREGDRIVEDEMIGVIGSMGGDIIYADSIIRADLPIPNGLNTTEQKVEAAYISDLHLGSEDTMYNKLDRFAEWLNSDEAKNIGYLVIAGDIVEGVGTYPGQEDELMVTDIYKQYEMFEEWVQKLPERIQIIVGPGNHDISRLAEPQPRLPEKVFPEISDYNNVHLVQNPQTVRLHGIESDGIVNLMYHGYSFDEHADQIKELREKGYEEPHHVMIDLLKRRHLAPMYGSNLMAPEPRDHLVIEQKPDVFVSGHFHSHSNESYKGVNVINSSSFQAQTDFQKRVGHQPDPGKVTIVDYKTRETRVKKFV